MNSTNDTTSKAGINGEKIAAWAIFLMIVYLIWNQ